MYFAFALLNETEKCFMEFDGDKIRPNVLSIDRILQLTIFK